MKSINDFLYENNNSSIYTNLKSGMILYCTQDFDKWSELQDYNKQKCKEIKIRSVEDRGIEKLIGDKYRITSVRCEDNPMRIDTFEIHDKPNEENKEFIAKSVYSRNNEWWFVSVSKEGLKEALQSKYAKKIQEVDDEISKLQNQINYKLEQKAKFEAKMNEELE